VSLKLCSVCQERIPGKPGTVYWAWVRADNTRVCWKQSLDIGCFAMNVLPLQVAAEDPRLACPLCHSDTTHDMDAIFMTVCVPGRDCENVELATCGPCAVGVRNTAEFNAEFMPDRGREFGGRGPQPMTSSVDAWAQMGIQAREAQP
jgi:hypothetical protein